MIRIKDCPSGHFRYGLLLLVSSRLGLELIERPSEYAEASGNRPEVDVFRLIAVFLIKLLRLAQKILDGAQDTNDPRLDKRIVEPRIWSWLPLGLSGCEA